MGPKVNLGLPQSYQNYDSIASEVDSTVNETDSKRNNESAPGNEYVLNFAFWSFVLFCTLQGVFAIIAKSQAMLADSQAMFVDALTYLFNLIAERWKNRACRQDVVETVSPEVLEYRKERLRLYLELVPPLISATILSMVTIASTREALNSLTGNDDDDDDVNVGLMLLFSFWNLILDLLNVTCFAKAHHAYGLGEVKKEPMPYSHRASHAILERTESFWTERNAGEEFERQDDEPKLQFAINLNMCSAWTHVMADTLRSTAVLVAATIAFLFESVGGSVADSLATLVVSAIILISLLPLVQGLMATIRRIIELRNIAPVLDV